MAKDRKTLNDRLKEFVGDNVYFQRPENSKLKYPCIIYTRNNSYPRYANNKRYINYDRYELILIYRDPDSVLPKKLLNGLRYCRLDRHYVEDNLYHDAFNLYYPDSYVYRELHGFRILLLDKKLSKGLIIPKEKVLIIKGGKT